MNSALNSNQRSIYVSWKVLPYPSHKPTLTLTSHLGQNVGLGEGWVVSFPETYDDSQIKQQYPRGMAPEC